MRDYNTPSERKIKLLDEFNNSDLKAGEYIYISEDYIKKNIYCGLNKNDKYPILSINGDDVTINNNIYEKRPVNPILIKKSDIGKRFDVLRIGSNPFNERRNSVRPAPYALESIIHMLKLVESKNHDFFNEIKATETNWNPFVYDTDGKKHYYQRDFCWTVEQEQLLIESIYKGIGCGMILIRRRSWEELEDMAKKGETELSFNDIVDGKQRLNAIRRFLNNEFMDLHGNYYNDLSYYSQIRFVNHQLLQYAELEHNTTDEETVYQFLLMNFEGIPQSKEHLNFVTNILNIVQK